MIGGISLFSANICLVLIYYITTSLSSLVDFLSLETNNY
jgi:hypothetical protein